MQPLRVVIALDELRDVIAQIIQIDVLGSVNLLPLQRLEKALAAGVVLRVCRPAHTWHDAIPVQDRDVLGRRVLDAAVGVVDQASQLFDGEALSSSLFTGGGADGRAKRLPGVASCTFLISFARTHWHCRTSRSSLLRSLLLLVFHPILATASSCYCRPVACWFGHGAARSATL